MSELKAYRIKGDTLGDFPDVYIKSEADAVLAEKDKVIAELDKRIAVLKGDITDLRDDKRLTDTILDERNAEISELKDKCQMHDFFWEGCGFAKRGFKNTIAVSEAFNKLEAENGGLKDKLRHYPMLVAIIEDAKREIARDKYKIRHQKYKRCVKMASNCRLRARWFGDNAFYKKEQWALRWHKRWLELAEKFKEAK